MRKLLAVFLVVLMSALIFTQSITYWHTQVETDRQQRIRALAQIFQAQTGIKVNLVPIEENEILEQIPRAVQAGTLPDVIEGGISPILLLGSQGFMDTKLNAKIIEDFGDVYTGVSRLMQAPDGGYYGVPLSAWVQGIWYKTNLFEEKNLGAPISWYNILTAAKTLHDPQNRFYGLVLPKRADAYTEQVFTQVALSNGARPIDTEGNILFNTPEMIQAFAFYKELGKYSRPGFTGVPEALNAYLNNEAAMVFYSTYIMDDIAVEEVQKRTVQNFDPKLVENTGFANMMMNIRPSSFGEVIGIGILDTSKNKDAAEQWVKFLMSGSNYIYFLHMAPGGMNPTRSSIAEMDEFMDNPVLERYGKEQITTIISALETVERFEFVEGQIIDEMAILSGNFVIGRAINQMFANDWTPEQTAQWAQKEAERVLGR
ncbi:ABC transporter substrate-binding protein [Petrotoga sp. 9PWA.NaAc.5.4]|uniref:ABC transporter substrate-binding protein n=1 Tax=Petrotoga sp. 9PWA.NaAc.5.4 TaxID=1434328 RepID=UPI000CC8CA46|nr:ABC transporter substrate-binding protein [Petrotoga sp. 9PWA.NaAc.5.4]PNR92463.1 ABC transporter substrate-binding protein [Petrotoga sp. 9PWA.NaAc.5.4]